MKAFRNDVKFALWMLPVTLLALALSLAYQLQLFADQAAAAIQQMGGMTAFALASILPPALFVFVLCVLGRHLAGKLGLRRPFSLEKKPLVRVIGMGLVFGLVLLADHFWLGGLYPPIQQANRVGNTPVGIAAAVVYGGIVEELLLRLFFMSLLVWLLWKCFARGQKTAPAWAFAAGNGLAAALFAAGHLPATVALFGGLDAIVVLRCFVLNGGAGLCFGLLYQKYGLQYAMLAHMACHLCFKLLLALFL